MRRRDFLCAAGVSLGGLAGLDGLCAGGGQSIGLPGEWRDVPVEFSMAPFWFWNDTLSQEEIVRQMEDFRAHGVYAFVIHPRAGLPRDTGWMSERMLGFMRCAIEEAQKRRMWVVLYDEGMYPSGSSSGQVVAENPAYKCRGMVSVDLDDAKPGERVRGILIGDDGECVLSEGQNLVAVVKRKVNGHRIAVVDKQVDSVIRGLHFREADPERRKDHREVAEDSPPAGDILNPKAVACFIRLVYQRYYDEFGKYFGGTVKAIFTDEPSMVGRLRERGVVAGTTGILEHVNRYLGYDFAPQLAALWYGDEPEAQRYRSDYNRALEMRLEETYYGQLRKWCDEHNTNLTGHPAKPDDIGHLRYFNIPGQDIVWRYVEPGKASGLEGAQSTQAKCTSSAMVHLGLRRNSNEFCGAYGHDFTFEQMKWLARWLTVRGCNLLYPHAFYYSIRGPRIDERPPDVGPNSPWWGEFGPFAKEVSRLCWLNTDSRQVCGVAILGRNDYLPWWAAKVCFQHQRDFNYIEARHLWDDARVDSEGIRIAGMHYRVLVIGDDVPDKASEAVERLSKAGRTIKWTADMQDDAFVAEIDRLARPDVRVTPSCADLRARHVVKEDIDWYMLFNEGETDISFHLDTAAKGRRTLLDAESGQGREIADGEVIALAKHAVRILAVRGK